MRTAQSPNPGPAIEVEESSLLRHGSRQWSHRAMVACGLSVGVHAAALAALAASQLRPPIELPMLKGQRNVAGVELIVSQLPREPEQQVTQLERLVIVKPEQAQVGEQHFVYRLGAIPLPAIDRPELPPVADEPESPQPIEAAPPLAMELAEPVRSEPVELAPPPRPAREMTPPAVAARPQSIGSDEVTPPRLLSNAPPVYPAQARVERREGTVVLRLEVDVAGRVARVEIATSSGHDVLDAAALRAVRGWRFAPALQGGRPTTWTGRLPVQFVLN